MQADAPHPVSQREKQKLDPKQTKSAGGCPKRRTGKFTVQLILDLTKDKLFIDRWRVCAQVVREKNLLKDKDIFLGPIIMLRSAFDITAVGMLLRPSDVPDLTV